MNKTDLGMVNKMAACAPSQSPIRLRVKTLRPWQYLLVLVLLLSSCALFETDTHEVEARSASSKLLISNHTTARVYYFVVGRETAALILWAPSLDSKISIARGATAQVAHKDIYRDAQEKQVIVYWWHARELHGEMQPDEIQALVVTL